MASHIQAKAAAVTAYKAITTSQLRCLLKKKWCQGLFLLYNASIGFMACMRSGHLHPTWISWYHWYIIDRYLISLSFSLYHLQTCMTFKPCIEIDMKNSSLKCLKATRSSALALKQQKFKAAQPWTGPLRLRRSEEDPLQHQEKLLQTKERHRN